MRTEKQSSAGAGTGNQTCPDDDSGLQLPAGFCATVFADGIGHARHMVVAPNEVLYINTWSGRYFGDDTPHAWKLHRRSLKRHSGHWHQPLQFRFRQVTAETVQSQKLEGPATELTNCGTKFRPTVRDACTRIETNRCRAYNAAQETCR